MRTLAALIALTLFTVAGLALWSLPLEAGPPPYVVDTVDDAADDDTGDGDCAIAGSGLCSLRAAIEQVNADGGGTIEFDETVFAPPGGATIELGGSGQGELPEITVPLTIDTTGASVVVLPANAVSLDWGFFVRDDGVDSTDFVIEGGLLTIRGFVDTLASDDAAGDGIYVCGDGGDGCGSATVQGIAIRDVSIFGVEGGALVVVAGDDSDLLVQDTVLLAGTGDPAIDVSMGDFSQVDIIDNEELTGPDGVSVSTGESGVVTLLGNETIEGGDDGVTVDVGEGSTVALEQNTAIMGFSGDAVTVEGPDLIEVELIENDSVDGVDNGLEIALGNDATVFVIDNTLIRGAEDPGIEGDVGEDSTVSIEGNEQISTSDNGAIEFVAGDGAEVFIEFNDTLSGADEGIVIEGGENVGVTITEQSLIIGNDDDAIGISGVGLRVDIDSNIMIDGATGDGIDISGDLTSAVISNNGLIIGRDGHGIDIGATELDSRIDNLLIENNTLDGSSEQGIDVSCDPGDGCAGGATNAILSNEILSNGLQGVRIRGGSLLGGFTMANNLIVSNDGPGIHIINSSDNLILENEVTLNGDSTTGVLIEEDGGTALRNTISRNSTHNNPGLGIDLGGDGVTPNDAGDADDGPNGLLNFPTGLTHNQVAGTVTGQACAGCTIEVFLTDAPPDTHGEGETFLADGTATGSGAFIVILPSIPCESPVGMITATATDVAGNTSEFSANAAFAGGLPCATDTPTPSPTQTVTMTPTPQPQDGDLNKDGATNSLDAALILQFTAGLFSPLPNADRADVDQSGTVTAIDAALILQFDAGLIDALPV